MQPNFKNYLLETTGSSDCEEVEIIQSLWSGYGKISRYKLVGSAHATVIVKHIDLNSMDAHPRGWDTDFSHNRKVKSYQIESTWYESWSHRCSDHCRIPRFIGSYSEDRERLIIMEDLDAHYPLRNQQVSLDEAKACIKWLANFHATFLNEAPTGLWECGTYWHLDTRPDEFEKIEHQELKTKAHIIDGILKQAKYQTIVHGDAKLANFCFSESGNNVAAVDFQYVGGGCGMKDVAYFLGSCFSGSECEQYEEEVLDFYFHELREALIRLNVQVDFKSMETEWRKMYPLACADFARFLLGWMPSHQKLHHYNLNILESVLAGI